MIDVASSLNWQLPPGSFGQSSGDSYMVRRKSIYA